MTMKARRLTTTMICECELQTIIWTAKRQSFPVDSLEHITPVAVSMVRATFPGRHYSFMFKSAQQAWRENAWVIHSAVRPCLLSSPDDFRSIFMSRSYKSRGAVWTQINSCPDKDANVQYHCTNCFRLLCSNYLQEDRQQLQGEHESMMVVR